MLNCSGGVVGPSGTWGWGRSFLVPFAMSGTFSFGISELTLIFRISGHSPMLARVCTMLSGTLCDFWGCGSVLT